MSFIAALATIGTTIAEGAALAGGALASGAAAAGSGLAAGAGALGSGIGALGTAIGEGAMAAGEGIAGLAGEGAAAGAEGAAAGAEGAAAGTEGIGALAANPLAEFAPTTVEAVPVSNTAGLASIATPTLPEATTLSAFTPTTVEAAPVTNTVAGSNVATPTLTEPLAANPLAEFTPTEVAPQQVTNTVADTAVKGTPELTWSQQAVQGLGMDPASMSGKIASEGLKQGVYGAGIGGLGGALTHPNDPMGGALQGAGMGLVTGGIGGSAAGAIGAGAGSSFLPAKFTEAVAKNPGIAGAAIGLPVSMGLSALTTPTTPMPTTTSTRQANIDPNKYKYTQPQWTVARPQYFADGGLTDMPQQNGIANLTQSGMFPQSQQELTQYATPSQMPTSAQVVNADYDAPTNPYTGDIQGMADGGLSKLIPGGTDTADSLVKNSLPGMIFDWKSASDLPVIGGLFNKPEDIATLTPEEKQKLMAMAANQQPGMIPQQPQQMAQGGIADLGGYAAGGRPNLLHGPGDGVSDSIPASIAGKQPARLASGEYVISSRIVSELGNGSTDAGAQRLDDMVKRIQAGRSKTMGKNKEYAKDTKPYKHLPA